MMKMLLSFAALTLAAAPALAVDRAAPTGKWTVGLEERGCTLFREFSGGGEDYSLHVTPDPGSGKTELVLLHKKKSKEYRRLSGVLSLDDGESIVMRDLQRFPRSTGWTRYGMMLDDADALRSVDRTLAVSAGRAIDVELQTGSMDAAIGALKTCEATEG